MQHPANIRYIGPNALVLLLLVLLAYIPAWPGSFLWDDDAVLIENPHIHAADGLKRIWFSAESIEYYPVFFTSLRWQWKLFGDRPGGYLAVNLALHLLNAFLLWAVLHRMGVRGAYWGAVFFALHPVAAHAVAWINQHKTVLSTTFYLASTLSFILHAQQRRRADPLLCLSFLFFILGLLTKPTLVLLPVFLFALARALYDTPIKKLCFIVAPWLVIAGLAGVMRITWFPPPEYALSPLRAGEGWVSWAVAGWSIWFSAWKIVLPWPLMMMYPRWPIASWTAWAMIPLILLMGTLFTLWWHRARHPRTWLAFLFFILAMVPVSGIFDNTYFAFSHVANHWLYPAMLALVPLAAVAWLALCNRCSSRANNFCRWIPGMLAGALLLLTGWESYRYHDPAYYYSRGVRENPDNVIAHHNLANVRLEQGDKVSALQHYLEAIRIHPTLWQARIGAGKLLSEQGDYKEAFNQFRDAYAIFPDNPEVHFHLALLYGIADRTEEAIRYFHSSLDLNPQDPVAWNNLGVAYLKYGEMAKATSAFEQALLLHPEYTNAQQNLNRVRTYGRE